ncbi:alpha/beta fold hydrolase [Helicovermis profundi]|uniref:Alpha/beta hydrolase n=1 Tax=Helicovermis profundi TaxID=3065157 RepID=A0AAU9E6E9_9FIRM|nr:alpha/beta hydrolase [Clostridia bacterium S502]
MNIKINGLNINYEIKGEGKPILLLHGWGANIESFRPVIESLNDNFKVITLDFPGFGKSQEPNNPIGIFEYADITEKFIEKLNIVNPILFGHSFGGRVSIILASKLKINKIVLIDSAGIKPKRSKKYYLKVYTYKFFKKVASIPGINLILKEFMEEYRNKAGSSDYNNASPIMKKVLSKVVNEDLRKFLPKIKSPVLLVWGENDTETPLSDAKLMNTLLQNSGIAVLKGVGHFSYLEKLNEFLIIINNFLEEDK